MDAVRPWLYIGRYRETQDYDLLVRAGISAMLQLAEQVRQPGIETLYLAVRDGETLAPATLRRGLDFVLLRQRQGQKVLVACGAGISRAATFTIAALKEAEGLSLAEAARIVRQAHPESMPHPRLWACLCAYYHEPLDYRTLLMTHN